MHGVREPQGGAGGPRCTRIQLLLELRRRLPAAREANTAPQLRRAAALGLARRRNSRRSAAMSLLPSVRNRHPTAGKKFFRSPLSTICARKMSKFQFNRLLFRSTKHPRKHRIRLNGEQVPFTSGRRVRKLIRFITRRYTGVVQKKYIRLDIWNLP